MVKKKSSKRVKSGNNPVIVVPNILEPRQVLFTDYGIYAVCNGGIVFRNAKIWKQTKRVSVYGEPVGRERGFLANLYGQLMGFDRTSFNEWILDAGHLTHMTGESTRTARALRETRSYEIPSNLIIQPIGLPNVRFVAPIAYRSSRVDHQSVLVDERGLASRD